MLRVLLLLLVSLATPWATIMLSGKGVLTSQHVAQPGNPYWVDGWGDVGKGDAPSLVCTYFVGTGIKTEVFWYSPEGIFGKAECPLFFNR